MSKSKFSCLTYKAKSSFLDIFKSIKWQMIITAFVILIGFFVGIYYAFSCLTTDYVNEDLVLCFLTGNMSSFSSLLFRILSALLVLGLLFLCSKSKWLAPLALILIFYRAYLLGINIGIMLRFYGMSGIIVAILIILPVQFLMLLFFGFFYWGTLCSCDNIMVAPTKFFLISALIIFMVGIILALLLVLFSPNVILVL